MSRVSKTSLVIAGIHVALGMSMSLLLGSIGFGRSGWIVPYDIWVQMDAARYVALGALGYIYEATPALYALPMGPIALAPVAFIGDLLSLTDPFPIPIPRPTMWLIVGPVLLGSVGLVSWAAGRLAEQTGITRVTLAQVGAALLCSPLVLYGHIEDIWALTLLLVALKKMAGADYIGSAISVGFAISFKQWAILLVPLVAGVAREKIVTAATSLALPVALAAFVLIVDPIHATGALLGGQNNPSFGHLAPWVDVGGFEVDTLPFRAATFILAGVAGALLARRARRDMASIAGIAGLVLIPRVLLEPVLHPYYAVPAVVLFLLDGIRAGKWTAPALLAASTLAWYAVYPGSGIWWVVSAALTLSITTPTLWRIVSAKPPAPESTT